MKIILSETQYYNILKSINEEKNAIDALNKFIETDKIFKYGSIDVYLTDIKLSGTIDDVFLESRIEKVIYENKDVTDFALNYAIYDQWTGDDLPLGTLIKNYLSDSFDKIVRKTLKNDLSSYDVVLNLI